MGSMPCFAENGKEPFMNLTNRKEGSVLYVTLDGRLDSASAAEIEGPLYTLVHDSVDNVVIDCQNMDYIASSGLRILLALYKMIHPRGGEVVLKNVDPYVMEIFEMTGFTDILKIEK